jgi:hypothetical protein
MKETQATAVINNKMAHMPLQIITKQKTKGSDTKQKTNGSENMEETAERQCPTVTKRCREDDLHDLLRTRPQKHVVTL